MKCHLAERLISDHVDNLLEKAQTEKLERHLKECPHCRLLMADMKAIIKNTGDLPVLIPPDHMWSQIKNKVDGKPKNIFPRFLDWISLAGRFRNPAVTGFAALVVITILLSITKTLYNPFINENINLYDEMAIHQIIETENDYLRAIESLSRAIDDQQSQIPPGLEQTFTDNLKIIDNAIMACKQAIREHPDSLFSTDYLMLCYRKKYDLLNEIKELTLFSS